MKRTRHYLRKTKVYNTWHRIKNRCYREDDVSYKHYGLLGITFQYKDDFIGFFNEVGHPPTPKHTIDRIDNDLGYVKGNMRWVTSKEQARNKGMNSNNTTGVTGVYWEKNNRTNATRAIAKWVDLDGKQKSKSFSVNRLGLLPAFAEAVKYRRSMIEYLNKNGAGYTEKHGL